jgi:microcystin-dependent protein
MDFFIGEIRAFAMAIPGGPAPRGWHVCDGSLLQIVQNQALFALLGNAYGGDGKTNFALPDLRGRAMVSQGPYEGGAPAYSVGNAGGVESVALGTTQLPPHTHSLNGNTGIGTAPSAVNNLPAAVATPNVYAATQQGSNTMAGDSLASSGGGASHGNMQPSLVINYCIATTGLFPTRP